MTPTRWQQFRVWSLAVLLSACSLPVDEDARRVDARVDDIFVPVVDPLPVDDQTSDAEVVVWLVGGSGLRPSTRLVDVDARSASTAELLSTTLRELLGGPRARDASAGLRSALPPGTRLLGVTITGRLATVEVSSEIARVGGPDEVRAIAQIVLTATGLQGVERVRFVVDEEPVQVPLGSGALTARSVTAGDYEDLIDS